MRVEVEVRFSDVDALGHVNNVSYLTYFEHGRVRFWEHYFGLEHPGDFPFVLGRAEIDYLAPLVMKYPQIIVDITVPRIGNSSWDFAYSLESPDGKEQYAKGRTVQVCYDFETKTSKNLTEKMRAVFEKESG